MAYHAVEVGWEIMNGKRPEVETELIPVALITQKEVAEGYSGWAVPQTRAAAMGELLFVEQLSKPSQLRVGRSG